MSDDAATHASQRLPAVDGLRGLLACVVVAWHATDPLQLGLLRVPADLAVCGFFALSGYVLTRAWGAPLRRFLLRRFVRLWPTYALCLTIAYLVAGVSPRWSLYLWQPVVSPAVDPPIWSLCVEAWAMPFMPLFIWFARGTFLGFACALALGSIALALHSKLGMGCYFLVGAYLSRWEFRNRWLEAPLPQWLGRVSYSLYLSHWILMSAARSEFGPWGALMAAPLAFPIAWILWRFVEAPSIDASRLIGRSRVAPGGGAIVPRPEPISA